MKTNSSFFGIQFYGECWGDSDQYDEYGPSSNCVQLNGANVGKKWANYVYMLTGEGASKLQGHVGLAGGKAKKQAVSQAKRQLVKRASK